jgi:hypothetical protein
MSRSILCLAPAPDSFQRFEQRCADRDEGRHIAEHLLGPEQGCREPALPAPFVSLGVEQAADDRLAKYIVVERLFGITLGVVEEDPLNERRIHNVQSLQPEPPIEHGLPLRRNPRPSLLPDWRSSVGSASGRRGDP